MCCVCRGRMDPILHMTSEVRDDEGDVTTLEWSKEACERLVECNATDLIENPHVQVINFQILDQHSNISNQVFDHFQFSEKGFCNSKKPAYPQGASHRFRNLISKEEIRCCVEVMSKTFVLF
jgi:hypothetical protein